MHFVSVAFCSLPFLPMQPSPICLAFLPGQMWMLLLLQRVFFCPFEWGAAASAILFISHWESHPCLAHCCFPLAATALQCHGQAVLATSSRNGTRSTSPGTPGRCPLTNCFAKGKETGKCHSCCRGQFWCVRDHQFHPSSSSEGYSSERAPSFF